MDIQKLFANIEALIVTLSPQQKILTATNSFCETTMRKREDIVGLGFTEAYPSNPDDMINSNNAAQLTGSLEKAVRTKKTQKIDLLRYDILRPENLGGGYELRYWQMHQKPVLDKDGEVEFIIQDTRDVTRQELARQAQAESENRFHFMADAIPQLIDTNNAQGKSVYFNERWLHYTGKTLEELLTGGWSEAIHPDDLDNAYAQWEIALKNQKICQFDVRLKGADGSYRWFLSRYVPVYDEKLEVKMWIGSCTDIDDAKIMVDELLYANEEMIKLADITNESLLAVENERRLLENLIMQAPAFFATLNGPEHRFELVNPVYQQIFPNRKLEGRTVAEAIPEMVEQGFILILDDIYNSGEVFSANELPIMLDRKDNGILESFYANLIYQPIYDGNKITGILIFGYEVTEQVLIKKKLEETNNAK